MRIIPRRNRAVVREQEHKTFATHGMPTAPETTAHNTFERPHHEHLLAHNSWLPHFSAQSIHHMIARSGQRFECPA